MPCCLGPAVYPLSGLNGPYDDFNAVARRPCSWTLSSPSPAMTPPVVDNLPSCRTSDRASRPLPRSPPVQAARAGHKRQAHRRVCPHPESPRQRARTDPACFTPGGAQRLRLDFDGHPTRSLTLNREPLPFDGGGELPKGAVWMFDSDHEGRRNLYFADGSGRVRPFFGNEAKADDAYASYDFKRHELLFCSNRSGSFRLYRYKNLNKDMNFSPVAGQC